MLAHNNLAKHMKTKKKEEERYSDPFIKLNSFVLTHV